MLVFFHSIKSRLLFLISLITLPGLLIILFQAISERNNAVESATEHATHTAEYLAVEQIEIIEEAESFLEKLALSPAFLSPEKPECSAYLSHVLDLSKDYVNLGAPRSDGELLCSALPLNKHVNVADRPYIQQAIKNRGFSIGKFQFDRAAQTTSINFAYPVINPENNKIIALTVAVLSLDWWSNRLDHASLPSNSSAFIIDSEEKIIATYPENKTQLGLPLKQVQYLAQSAIGNKTKVMEDNKGFLKIFVYRDLITKSGQRLGRIIVGIPFDQTLAEINSRNSQTALFFISFIFLLVIFSIYSINKSILTPLKHLKTSTKQLEKGLHADNQLLGGTAELIDLQAHFSSMAKTRLHAEQQLKNSQDLLQESEQLLLRHMQNTPLGTISWDINFICTEWNKAAERIFGYSAGEAIGYNVVELIVPLPLRHAFIKNYHFLLENKGGDHFQSQHMTKHGLVIACNWYNTLIMNNKGEVNGIGTLVQDITEDKYNQETLNHFFKLPINLHLIASFDGTLLKLNEAWESILGYQSDELIGFNLLTVIHKDDIDKTNKAIKKHIRMPQAFNFESRCLTKQGNTRLIAWSATSSVDQKSIFAIGRDITESKQAEEKLKLAAGVFTHAKEAIMITDVQGNIVDVNNTFVELSGYTKQEVIGENPRLFQSGRQSARFYRDMWQSINENGKWTGEIWNKRKNGEIYPELITISSIYDDHGILKNYIALFTDITEIKAHQKQLEHIAHYDVLTGLPNRTLLTDKLLQAMPQCKHGNQSLAVAFLDLDGFKAINDLHGHAVGDKVLVTIAQRLSKVLRDGDTLARVSGDEFIAIFDLQTHHSYELVLDRLLETAATPINIEKAILSLSASIGVTVYPHDNVDAEQLLRHADQAMYTAKQEGKNRYHLFDMLQDSALKDQHTRLVRIRRALQENEFVLYYQPKVNMKTGELIGAEALIRWQHPELGLLPPIEFLPIIEHHKLTIDVGEWVIHSALTQVSIWQKQGLNLTISVNINALHLQQTNFVHRLAEQLNEHPDVQPNSLQLEVLETSKLGDIKDVSHIMHQCIKLGVNFALDDFGTGYCSLTYLKQLPVNLVKIDQSFIRDMLDDPDDLSIVRGVIGLSQAFNRDVIAEGVETREHGSALLDMGCELAQGYGIARPMPAEAFPDWAIKWLTENPWSNLS